MILLWVIGWNHFPGLAASLARLGISFWLVLGDRKILVSL